MMKRMLVCAALAVGCLAQLGFALPDLIVSQLDVSPVAPVDGSLVTISATIENTGSEDTNAPFFARFTVDGHEIDVIPLTSLTSRRSKEVTTTWSATAGPHILSIAVDAPHDRIDESNEENNSRSVALTVHLDEDAMAALAPLRIAIARFDDLSGAGFIHVGEGVSSELADRFAAIGLRVIDHVKLDSVMQSNGLNPALPNDVAAAGRLVGADLLVLGSVLDLHVQRASLSLGFFRVDYAEVDAQLSAQVIDARSTESLVSVSAEGHNEGTDGFSIDFGELLSFLSVGSSEVCSVGLQADRAWYHTGQTALFGFQNESTPAWFGIEIYSSTGAFLKWLGWQFVATGDCATWSWDQCDGTGAPMSSGIYTAKLWNGTSYIETVGFQIRPGISLSAPSADEITVGTARFDETVVGGALNQAADQLTSTLLLSMADVAGIVGQRAEESAAVGAAMPEAAFGGRREGQIAAILPDRRIAINLGSSSGVTVDDRFEVLEVQNLVLDPVTSEILDYGVIAVRGDIRVVEVRDRVSYAVAEGGFLPAIGDVVRAVP